MAQGIYCGEYLTDGRETGPMIYEADRHGLVIGPTGCGKSSSFIVNNLLGDNLNGMSAIMIDPKAELTAVCALQRAKHGEVRIIDPFGVLRDLATKHPKLNELAKRGLIESVGFNPLASLDITIPSFYDDCAAIGEALIQVSGNDPHWAESAQGLLVGLIMYEKVTYGEKASLAHVRAMLTEPEQTKKNADNSTEITAGLRFYVRKILAIHKRAADFEAAGRTSPVPGEVLDVIASLVSRFDGDSREIQSIKSTADTQTRWLLSPLMKADLEKPGLDFRDLKTRPVCCFVILPSARLRTHSVWLRLVIVTALRRLYVDGGVRTMIFIDEMPALGYLPPLVDAYALVRGYKIGIVGIAQDLNQLKALYKDHWETFIANAGYIICWGPNDLTSSEWMSRRTGKETRIARSVGSSTPNVYDPQRDSSSENESYVGRPRFLPQELFGMGKGVVLVFLAGLSDTVIARLHHYTQMKTGIRAGYNPY